MDMAVYTNSWAFFKKVYTKTAFWRLKFEKEEKTIILKKLGVFY